MLAFHRMKGNPVMKIKETFLFTICSVVICISLLIHMCLPIRAFAQSTATLTRHSGEKNWCDALF